jgi:hypothetical protein
VYGWGRHDGAAPVEAKLERERAQWATSQANALDAEIKRSNEMIDQLRSNHAEATERAAKAESQALAASAAADSAGRMARRVRDASATDLLAARAAIEAAGATATCGPALDAAAVRDGLLSRCIESAQGLGSRLTALARYADDLKGDDAACRKDYATVTR